MSVEFKFRHPSSLPPKKPSQKMTEALRLLTELEEMQPLAANARAQRRRVVVEVFHRSDGTPLLIHAAAVADGQ
jgi:hypothetical protein